MSIGNAGPMTCCDSDCAGANGCRIGGYECRICGRWYCGEDMHEADLCEDCWDARDREEGEEEDDDAGACA